MIRPVRFAVAAVMLAASGAADASDHTNLENGQPVTVEDAYTIALHALETQGFLRYDRTRHDDNGPDRLELVPRFEFGPARNLQISVEVPYTVGDATETHQGEGTVQALYNFNNEGRYTPAVAIEAGLSKPFGRDEGGAGVETSLGLFTTKSLGAIGRSYLPRRMSINAIWYRNTDPRPGERQDRYRVGAAYDQPVANDWVLVADMYRETDRLRGEAENVAELGTRFQLTPQTVLTAGAGAGLGDQSPRFRLLIGIQHTLSVPWRRPR